MPTDMTDITPVYPCPECETEYEDESEAEECCQYRCRDCRDLHSTQTAAEECCTFGCPSCGERYEYESDAENCCQYQCGSCGDWYTSEDDADRCCRRGGDPYYPRLGDVEPYSITIPVLDDRAARWLSIEQELTAGGAAVAQMLYDEGLSVYDSMCDYSHSPDIGGIAVCEDGSLPSAGGEVKYSRFDLSKRADQTRLSHALMRIRQLHKDANVVNVGSSAGMHIHGAAKDTQGRVLGPLPMTALHELFSHGEDMIYGLAAAGWPRHRYQEGGNDYAKPIPKVSGKTPWKVANVMGSKYYGINFERLLNTVNRCQCGSVRYGAWSECECGAFDRATVEWRVFNTSTKPETIHAWLLFVAAVMEMAHHHTPGTLPDQPFIPRYATQDAARRRRWQTLDWFLMKAPLTHDEQAVIRDAACRSPLMTVPVS